LTVGWNFADIFEAVAVKLPDSEAVVDGERRLTWTDFDGRADAFAHELSALGLRPGETVGVYLRNCTEFLEAYYGALKVSCVPVNVNYRYGADELVYLLDNADCQAVVIGAEFAPMVAAVAERLPRVRRWYVVGDPVDQREHEIAARPDACAYEERIAAMAGPRPPEWAVRRTGDDRFMVYTGGTTGLPKGVVWRQTDLFDGLIGSSRVAFNLPPMRGLDELVSSLAPPGPRGLSASPFMHGTGLLHQFVMLLSGGTCVVLPGRRFDARVLLAIIAAERVTAIVIVGDAFARPMLDLLDAEPDAFDLSSLQVISSSGATWSQGVKRGLLRHLPHVTMFDSLASSEGFGLARTVSTAEDCPETTRFVLGPHVRVRTDEGRFLDPGDEGTGMLVVTGPLPMGYYKDEAKTTATFQTVDGVRYSAPGDYVRLLADSSVQFLGRGTACINTGGEKVYAEEVEQIVKAHPAAADAAVVGAPDERFGAVVTAVVQLKTGATLNQRELADHVKRHLADYKAPRRLLLVDELPRTVQGKLDYAALAGLVAAAQEGASPSL
jgi:fatty-acyl-CoA synthase